MDAPSAIARGAALTFLGYAGKLAWPIALALFARIYGLPAVGVVLLIWSWVEIAQRLAGLGLDKGLQRFVPAARDDDERHRVVAAGLVATLATTVPVAAALALVAPLGLAADLAGPARVAMLLALPALGVGLVGLHAVRGLKQVGALVWARSVVEPVGFLIAGLAAGAVTRSPAALLAAQVVATLGVTAFGLVALGRRFPLGAIAAAALRPRALPVARLVGFSLPLALADAATLALLRIDLVVVGWVTGDAAAVGAYGVAREIVTALAKIRQGFDQVAAPVAAELHARGRGAELERSAALAARWSAALGAPLGIVLMLYPSPVLAIFAVPAGAVSAALAVLAAGRLLDCATGPTAVLLGMVGRPRLVLANAVAGLATAVVGHALLAPRLGVVGAATATSLGLVVLNLLALAELARLEGVRPLGPGVSRVALAAAISAVGLAVVRRFFPAPATAGLFAIGVPWFLAYLGVLATLGLAPEEWRFVSRLRLRGRAGRRERETPSLVGRPATPPLSCAPRDR